MTCLHMPHDASARVNLTWHGCRHSLAAQRHQMEDACTQVAVSIIWGVLSWVSSEKKPYFYGPLLRRLIFGNSHIEKRRNSQSSPNTSKDKPYYTLIQAAFTTLAPSTLLLVATEMAGAQGSGGASGSTIQIRISCFVLSMIFMMQGTISWGRPLHWTARPSSSG